MYCNIVQKLYKPNNVKYKKIYYPAQVKNDQKS